MRDPTLDDFQGRTGESYAVGHEGGEVPLVLTRVVPLPQSARDGEAFQLDWLGPADLALPQATYIFSGPGGPFEIFIVPVGRDDQGVRYEAIFN